MSNVVLYSATGCPLCAKYKALLGEKGIRYQEKNTTEQPAYLDELAHGRDGMQQPFYCATPTEAQQTHSIITAARATQQEASTVPLA